MMRSVVIFLLALTTLAHGQATDSLRRHLQTARHDTTRLRLYTELVNRYADQDKNDSAYVYLQKMRPLASRLNHTYYLGRYYHSLGLYYRKKGLLNQSLGELQRAMGFYQRVNDTARYGRVLYTLSVVYADQGDTKQALAQSFSNLRYYERHRNSTGTLNTYGLLQLIYTRSKNPKLRQYYTHQFIRLADKISENKLNNKYYGYEMLAPLYEDQGDYDRAWPYRKQMVQMARQLNNSNILVETLSYAAANLRHRNQAKAALPYLYEALSMSNRFSEDAIMNFTWKELSLTELQLGHPQQALAAAQRSLKSIRSSGGRAVDVPSILLNLSSVQEATGHYKEALLTYKEYDRLQDSLYNAEVSLKGAQIEAQYNLEKKENAILLLNKNAQLQREQFVVVNQQRLLFGLGVAVLLLIAASTGYFLRESNQQNKEIQHQSQKLQQALQLRDKLFSILTHDLRSPVANLVFSLDGLQKNRFSNKRFTELKQQVNGVYATMDNLLYWALSQQNGLRARLVTVNLTELVNEVLDSFCGMITDRQLQVAVTHAQYENNVLADEKMTQISLRNIVHNAIKFSPVQGSITLTLEQTESHVYLTIRDTGNGMKEPDAVLSQVGGPTSEQGTSLGLAVSDELMRQNQGSLSIQSQPGEGTTVTLTFRAG